jgi:ATP-binding cassette, subfamily B, bacterial
LKSGNPIIYLFGKTWHYSEGNRKNVILYWTMFVIANTFSLILGPLITAKMINVIQRQGVTSENIVSLIWILLMGPAVALMFWALHGPARILEGTNGFKAKANYKKYLLRGVMSMPMEWHVEHHSGDTIDKIEKGTGALFGFSCDSFEVITLVVQLIISYLMLAYFMPVSAFIVLVMVLFTGWVIIRFDKVLLGQYKELNRLENKISESVFDAISNISTVIILRVESLVFNAIAGKIDKPLELFNKSNRLNEAKWFLMNMLCGLMVVFVLALYLWQNMNSKGILLGNIFILINYLERIRQLFFLFARIYGGLVRYKTKIMNSEELAQDFIPSQNLTNHVLPRGWKILKIDKLNFSYHGADENLDLDDISFSIYKGEKIALVGESGSGKTTFMKILRDLHHPQSVELVVDDKKINGGFDSISRAISLVPQNPEIFATTIMENITIGACYDFSFVRHFTDMACFTEVADNLPKGFNSSIKEKGVNLSGGQQQRLALARGLLASSDKDIILLDEPTSSLDTATEMRVYQNIFEEFRGKTIISSIHRLHLLTMFDRIYLFNGGHIVGSGSLGQLLEDSEKFRNLWNKYYENNN